MDAYHSTIMLGIALIIGSLTSTYLADKFKRRTLNLVSLLGAACGHIVTALFYYLSINGYDLSAYSYVPVASLSFIIFIAAIGIMPLAFVCIYITVPICLYVYIYIFIYRYAALRFSHPRYVHVDSGKDFIELNYEKPFFRLLFLIDSNKWNGHNLLFVQYVCIYIPENVPDFIGTHWHTRCIAHLRCRVYDRFLLCTVYIERNFRSIARRCWQRRWKRERGKR